MKHTILKRPYYFVLIAGASLLSNYLQAQKKLSLDINVGALQSIGRNIIQTYQSAIQSLQIDYYSKEKFGRAYFNLIPNLNYAINPNVCLGLQSGIYAHFYQPGRPAPISVTVPVMATLRVNFINIESNALGVNIAGGKNFFKIDIGPLTMKNGWLFNAAVFYLLNKKSIIKLGVEPQIDNGYVYFIANGPYQKDETFKYHSNRTAIFFSYGFIIDKL